MSKLDRAKRRAARRRRASQIESIRSAIRQASYGYRRSSRGAVTSRIRGTTGGDTGGGNPPVPGSNVVLLDDYRSNSTQAPILTYPRPDSETATWAKHRMHHTRDAYEVPIGVMFGNGPFNYEKIAGPSALTVGRFFPEETEVFAWERPGTCGLVRWEQSDLVIGTHTITIRVYFQGTIGTVGCPAPGYIDVTWTVTIRDDRTVYVDQSAPGGGDGSFSSPFQSIRDVLGPNLSDTTYSGYQVCFRGGTHAMALTTSLNGGATGGNWVLNSDDKPMVYFGFDGETVIADMTDTTISAGTGGGAGSHPSGSDFGWFNIITEGGPLDRNNPRLFFWRNLAAGPETYSGLSSGGSRWCFHKAHFRNFVNTTTSADNSAIFWCANQDPSRRHYGYISRVTFENCNGSGASVNFNGFYISNSVNVLEEHTKCINTQFGKASVVAKTGTKGMCHRYLDYSQAPAQRHAVYVAGSYDSSAGGPVEVWYLKVNNASQSGNTNDTVAINGGTDAFSSSDPGHFEIVYLRCNVSRSPNGNQSGGFRILSNWEARIIDCIVCANNRFRNANNAVILEDSGPTFTVANDPFDSDMNLVNPARSAHLGTDGAEIAVAGRAA
ncbi:MAG: hypothetical protein AAFR07_05695 [Pseudomonadota bacterium]